MTIGRLGGGENAPIKNLVVDTSKKEKDVVPEKECCDPVLNCIGTVAGTIMGILTVITCCWCCCRGCQIDAERVSVEVKKLNKKED